MRGLPPSAHASCCASSMRARSVRRHVGDCVGTVAGCARRKRHGTFDPARQRSRLARIGSRASHINVADHLFNVRRSKALEDLLIIVLTLAPCLQHRGCRDVAKTFLLIGGSSRSGTLGWPLRSRCLHLRYGSSWCWPMPVQLDLPLDKNAVRVSFYWKKLAFRRSMRQLHPRDCRSPIAALVANVVMVFHSWGHRPIR